MLVEVNVTICGSKKSVWAAITDVENATDIISGIDKIEILEKPASELVGLKWCETRMLFGKPATADKWAVICFRNGFPFAGAFGYEPDALRPKAGLEPSRLLQV